MTAISINDQTDLPMSAPGDSSQESDREQSSPTEQPISDQNFQMSAFKSPYSACPDNATSPGLCRQDAPNVDDNIMTTIGSQLLGPHICLSSLTLVYPGDSSVSDTRSDCSDKSPGGVCTA